jgi:hypothetical protein
MTDRLKKGDRITVVINRRRGDKPLPLHGEIIGEARDKHAWIIRRDDVKTPCAYHKDFCHPETPSCASRPVPDLRRGQL